MNLKTLGTMDKAAYLIMALPAIISFGGGIVAGLLHMSNWWIDTIIWIGLRFSMLTIASECFGSLMKIFQKRNISLLQLWFSTMTFFFLSASVAKITAMPYETVYSSINIIIIMIIIIIITSLATFVFWDSFSKKESIF